MKKNRMQNEAGFSLIEVIIALSVFAIGVLAVAKMQYMSIIYNADANRLGQATMLAQSKVEEFLALDFDNAALVDGDADGSGGLDDQTAATADGNETPPDYAGIYKLYWNIDAALADRKSVRVIVTWVDKGINRRYFIDNTLLR